MAKKLSNSKKKVKEYKFTRKPIFNIHHQADPLFAAKCHPSEPVFITGTATGHVQAYRYDIDKLMEIYEDQGNFPYDISCVKYDDFDDDAIISAWHTKRHKKSCRDLCFDLPSNGEKVHTIGSEGVIKTADVRTGQVVNKFLARKDNKFENTVYNFETYTKCVSVPRKNFLLVGDEGGNLMCHDTRSKNLQLCYKPFEKLHLGEGINSINYCWPKSDYKIITTGSTSVCELDLRKPDQPLHQSEDQEDEVLCAAWADQEKQETMICGMGDVVTVWKPKMNEWNDQISRIKVAQGETVESIISAMDAESRFMYTGCSNGHIAKVDIVGGKVVERFLQHDPEEDDKHDEVLGLDLDYNYRLTSFGTDGFKIWEEEKENDDFSEEEDLDSNDDSDLFSESDSDAEPNAKNHSFKQQAPETISSDDEEVELNDKEIEEDEEEEEIEDEEADSETEDITPRVKKTSLAESLKRQLQGATSNSETKKQKVAEDSASDIGEEIEDSDDETDITGNGKLVELKDVREQILANIDNPGDQKVSKKMKKKQKKEKKIKSQALEHGIRKFDDL